MYDTMHFMLKNSYLKVQEKYIFKGKKKMNKKLSKKNKRITLRLTEEQYAMLEYKSNELNMEKSDFLRQSIMASEINGKIDTRSIAQCLGNLNKISLTIESISFALLEASKNRKIGSELYKNVLDILITIKAQIRSINCLQK